MTDKAPSPRLLDTAWALDSWWKVILWWEVRRIPYNLVVGAAGVVTCLLVLAAAAFVRSEFGEEGFLPDPPLFAIFGVVFYGVAVNVCYTGGWVAELVARIGGRERARHFGEVAWVLGIAFAVLVTCVPFLVCWGMISIRLLAGSK